MVGAPSAAHAAGQTLPRIGHQSGASATTPSGGRRASACKRGAACCMLRALTRRRQQSERRRGVVMSLGIMSLDSSPTLPATLQLPRPTQLHLPLALAFTAIIIIGACDASSAPHTLPSDGLKGTRPSDQWLMATTNWTTTTTTTASGSSSQQSSSGVVNKSLDLQPSSNRAANDSRSNSNGIRRLLVRQLASMIRNHRPERIAREMESARVSGQLRAGISSSADEELAANSGVQSDSPAGEMLALNSEIQAGSAPAIDYELQQQQSAPQSSGLAAMDASNQDQQQQPATSLSQLDQTLAGDSGSSSGGTSESGGGDQYVTCPPDYEDPSMVEASGNLTSEQQQQLLAGVDSAGLLNADIYTNETDHEAQASRPHQSPCVQPGSRMIEVITKVITPILFSIIIVVGLLGNIIVMVVILEDRKTEREYTPTGLLILDISLADLSFIVFCIPFTGWDYSVGHWVFGSLWCKFNQYLIVVCALSSIYTLVLMSVDRFLAIVYPIECMSFRTSKNTLYAIYIKWIMILLIASPTIQMHGLVDGPLPDQYTCRFLSGLYNPLHFQIVFFITSYLFPLILIFCLYLSLLNKLWFGTKPHGHKESIKTLESKKKVTWLVAGIVVVFALCWCPIQVMLILMRLKSHKITATYVAIQVFAHTLGYMNSCVNPIVYAFASETFHNSFKRSSLGRFCYTYFCFGRHSHNHNNNLDNSHHNLHQQPDRSSNFRHIQHNNHSTVMNTEISSQHRLSQQMTNNILPRSSSRNTRNGHDSNFSATSLLNNNNNNCDAGSNKVMALPLEPRDRHIVPITGPFSTGTCRSPMDQQQAESFLTPGASTGGESAGNSVSGSRATPAKQQLVARMVQSGSQVSHKCEPCYQQQEPIGSSRE